MGNGTLFGKHPLVKPLVQRFMKGIFNLRPALPRQFPVLDPDIVLDYLSNLNSLIIKDMVLEKGKCTFFIKTPIKTKKTGFHQSPIVFSEYPLNRNICIVTAITHYLEIAKDLRITNQKPHKAVATSTIARWFKVTLEKAGIDIEKY